MKSTVSKALRNIVLERDSYTCVLCDNAATDMHHVTSRSQGGRNTPYNLVSLCRYCHMKLHRQIYCEPDERLDSELRILEYTSDYYADDDLYFAELAETNGYRL